MHPRTTESVAAPAAAHDDTDSADALESAALMAYRGRRALAEAIREAARRAEAAARLDAALRRAW
jgi:hypothetical protein